ncbi:MAG: hypothetical protein PHE48_03145 [Candidatus Daviesbacteria bacterium]|nr:hypothetical protein [Candidatus Daviesbacteria bacterium]MDD5415969.1 hypothetical protein [Candidatus Daviesbacteria bacterium]
MGRETRNFRQTGRSRAGNLSARNYAGINRTGYWGKIINFFKKGGYYGKS